MKVSGMGSNAGHGHDSHGHGPHTKSRREKAWCISKFLTFWWLNPLLKRGFKKPLQESDLEELVSLSGLEIEETTHKFQSHWENELKNYKSRGLRGNKPSLFKALFKAIGGYYAILIIPAIIIDGLAIVQPLFLKKLINYFTKSTSKLSEKDAYIYAVAYSLCTIASLFFSAPYYYHRKMVGLLAKEGCITLIYDKILKLSPTAYPMAQYINIGNLVASDAAKVEAGFFYLHYLILAPIEAIVVLYLLWEQISWSSFVGMGLLLLLAPLQVKMSTLIMNIRRQALESIDYRTKLIREVIHGIQVVKMYANEKLITKLIGNVRRTEISWLRKLYRGKAFFTSLFFCSSSMVCLLTFMTYVLTGNQLTATKVFTCVALFDSIKTALTLNFPAAVARLGDMRVSLRRIQNVLMLDELCPVCKGVEVTTDQTEPGETGIEVDNITASWTDDPERPSLRGMNFSVKQNQILSVIGEIGAGKSSILQAILGELPLVDGKIKIKGKIAYTSQQAWVYNGTVRNNIVFGKDYDEQWYSEVIKACALEKDLALFQFGDMSLVGEQGVALSGGQRARIGLARAVYSNADIYLLDDPLSAVDVHVGKHVFNKCIRGTLSNKACILVTHQFRYVRDSNQVIAVSGGEIVARGSFKDVVTSGIDFVSMFSKKCMEEEQELKAIAQERNDTSHHRRHSNASSASSWLPDSFHNQLYRSHQVTEIIEENEAGDGVAFQVPAFEEDHGKEEKYQRAVAISTYVTYFRSLHNIGAAIFILFVFVLAQALYMLADWWLSYWVDVEEDHQATSTKPDRDLYLGVYGGFTAGLLIVTLARTMIFYTMCLFTSCRLHNRMFNALLRAPIYFFEVNSIGRILNRFSKDTSYVDESLPTTLVDFLTTILMTVGVIVLVGAKNPITFGIVLPLFIFLIIERTFYIRTARDLKRLDGVSRSPLFGHFATTLMGLDTIRAFNAKDSFFHQFHHYLEANTRCLFGYVCVSSWLMFRLEVISAIFVSFVALISPLLKSSLSAATVGLILTYATKLSTYLAKSIKKTTEVESMMTAVERIEEYCNIEPEAPTETDIKPPKGWPDRGEIIISNLNYTYHESKPPVLHDINLTIKPAEKIGIVGRSGAGKSSLLSSLFRMAEYTGTCTIDGIDIKDLGLTDLRSGITIIPQEPLVFSSTLRRNLDPRQERDDAAIWAILEQVQLKPYVESLPHKLDTFLSPGGVQLSVGQRQLICLARAILYHTKVLVIDEATANVDSKTSKIIWDIIINRFQDCTVLTIAHRLFPVMYSDRVVVLEAGRIREIDSPHHLLQNPHSYLSHIVKDTDPFEEKRLRELAKDYYLKAQNRDEITLNKTNATSQPNTGSAAQKNGTVSKESGSRSQPNLTEIPQIQIESDTTCDTFF